MFWQREPGGDGRQVRLVDPGPESSRAAGADFVSVRGYSAGDSNAQAIGQHAVALHDLVLMGGLDVHCAAKMDQL